MDGVVDAGPPNMFCAPALLVAAPKPPNPPGPPNPEKPPLAPTLIGAGVVLALGAEGVLKPATVPNAVVAPKVGVLVDADGASACGRAKLAGLALAPKEPKAEPVPELWPNAPDEGRMSRDFAGLAAGANGFGVVVGVVDEPANPKLVEPKFGAGSFDAGVDGGVASGLSRPGALAGRDMPLSDPVGGVWTGVVLIPPAKPNPL